MTALNVRRWFRFSLATLLFLKFCLAGFFAGYHYGRVEGNQTAQSEWERKQLIVDTHYVGDILPEEAGQHFLFDLMALFRKLGLQQNLWVILISVWRRG